MPDIIFYILEILGIGISRTIFRTIDKKFIPDYEILNSKIEYIPDTKKSTPDNKWYQVVFKADIKISLLSLLLLL